MTELVLHIRLTAISNSHHQLAMQRSDGSTESAELETRSCLFHDLVHFAVETEAGLADAFFGRIANGSDHAGLAEAGFPDDSTDELAIAERVIGPLQGWLQHQRGSAADFVTTLRNYMASMSVPCPDWLNEALVTAVADRVRQLHGQWRGTPHGETMELTFSVPG